VCFRCNYFSCMESGVCRLELFFFGRESCVFAIIVFFLIVWWLFVGICCFSTGSVVF